MELDRGDAVAVRTRIEDGLVGFPRIGRQQCLEAGVATFEFGASRVVFRGGGHEMEESKRTKKGSSRGGLRR